TGSYNYSLIAFTLSGAILAFLFQNWEPSKIFMGDTGSLVIGTILSIVMIEFVNSNFLLSSDHPLKFTASVGTAIAVMIIPLVDTVRILIIRTFKNLPLLKADK